MSSKVDLQNDERKSENRPDGPDPSAMRTWLIRIGVVLLAFLLGLVPMWLMNGQLSAELEAKDRVLRRNAIHSAMMSAAIYSRRGEYETARQNTSTFYTELQNEIGKGAQGILTEQERIGLDRIMAERDEIITLLSRNDPASAERLSNVYVEYAAITQNK